MIKANYITVTEFEEFNPELDLSNYTAATISGMIRRASAYVDNYLNYSLAQESITGEKTEAVVNSTGELVIYTQKLNVQSVEQIKLVVGASPVTLQLTNGNGNSNVQIPSRKNSIVYPWMPFAWTGAVAITNFFAIRDWDIYTLVDYTAGYTTIPEDIKDAVNLLTRDIFVRQSNPMGLSSMSQGGISMGFRAKTGEGGKSDNILQAEDMLNSYKRLWGV